MYNQGYQREHSPDPLDEFFADLLKDMPDFLPASFNSTSASASTFAPAPPPPTQAAQFQSSSAVAANHGTSITPYYTPTNTQLTCQWLSSPTLPCGTPLSPDAKHACAHLRNAHYIRGNEKEMVQCYWSDCHVLPMQRGSLIRHVLTVHLGLLRWECEVCGRMFSRRGTAHPCTEGGQT